MPPLTGPKITLGGKVRTLRLTFAALDWARDQLDGATLAKIFYQVGQLDTRAILVMLCAALRHEDPPPSLEETAAMIEPPLKTIIDALTEALMPWIEEPKKAADAQGKPDSGPPTSS